MSEAIVKVRNLKKYYKAGLSSEDIVIKAVDGVSFDIKKGETFGLVGESGCGKTTTAKLILKLINATSGEIILNGHDINKIDDKSMRAIRKDIQVVFQNPYSALDTRMTIEDILTEPLSIHKIVSKYEYEKEIIRLLKLVGLSKTDMKKFPHEFSGGQRQRIGIARAIATRPKSIICDEPVSALDVSVQSQILNLLEDLQKEIGVSYLFIAHGLNVIKHMSNRVGVMYLGKIVELGKTEDVFLNPKHPYTKVLLSSAPIPDPFIKREKEIIKGEIPGAISMPKGCPFHPRCKYCLDICKEKAPFLVKDSESHEVACHISLL